MVKRWRRRQRSATSRTDDTVERHLAEFVDTREGVEAYVEPRTMVTETTLLLIAGDGEWTRRQVPSAQWASDFARRHKIPSYDAAVSGYPDRMRAWNRQKAAERKNIDIPDDLSGL
ncbi:MAG: hypothetical protein GEU93_14850 [Propionibacteriales bacterium]|nr:hypothetical protein [Propionibacteriales bacterium]